MKGLCGQGKPSMMGKRTATIVAVLLYGEVWCGTSCKNFDESRQGR